LYKFGAALINMGMQTNLHVIPAYLTALVEALRAKLRE
jgi:hypothetical protein